MKVYNQFTARLTQFKGEKDFGLSQTIPNQAVTAQELLRRFATGQPLGFKNVSPIYDEDGEEVPEFYKMNKLDRLHALQYSTENVIELKSDYEKLVQQQKREALQKENAEMHENNVDSPTERSEVQES